MSRKLLLALVGTVSMLASLLAVGPAGAQSGRGASPADDTEHPSLQVRSGTLPLDGIELKAPAAASRAAAPQAAAAAPADPEVGEVRSWISLDDTFGILYRKGYTLRALRDDVEIWVASEANRAAPNGGQSSGVAFLDTDCRNGTRTEITDAQANYLADQFQTNILPKESSAFSVAPDRDGSGALVGDPFNPSGPGQRTVVLVDNVRDDNFYDLNNTQQSSYIAGFFSSQLNTLLDRNVMTIDGFDWLHRTGANPPNEPVANDGCTSAPARPFLYEGVFAHEYQHLLESYEDSDEVNWVNEGLSDWAQTLTGYVDTTKPITDLGFDSHIQCFLGYLSQQTPANPNPRAASGPENSLTRWEDQGPGEILCDYGAAYSFMLMLAGRYGTPFMSALHANDANGFAGLQAVLDQFGVRKQKAIDVFHDWTIMVAVDGLLDDGATINRGGPKAANLSTPTLHATINWDTPEAYASPGAPSNGSDYVRLRDAKGAYLRGKRINSLSFKGATSLPPKPLAWVSDPNPPGNSGDPALYGGSVSNADEMAVQQVAVPATGAAVTFDARWNTELGWDFGFVQVSTDGGTTYTSVACTDTTTQTDPDALPTAKDNVPGFTGDSGGWRPQSCSLAAFAGQTVLLAIRAFTDPVALGTDPATPPGFWVDDVTVGATLLSDGSSTAGWRSFTEVKPVPVSGYVVTLISVRTRGESGDVSERNRGARRGAKITIKRLPLTADFQLRRKADVDKYIDEEADFVAAVVTYDDPAETATQYAPYTLTVNGAVQPGGK